MKFLIRLVIALTFIGLAFLLVLLFFWNTLRGPVYKPCAAFETPLGNDTISFPSEGIEARRNLGGMTYDTLAPFFLIAYRGDTLIRAHFRPAYNSGRFNHDGKDTATTFYTKGGFSTNYDAKGIYAYSFVFRGELYPATFEMLRDQYGSEHAEKTSPNYKVPYIKWSIGPCHQLLLFRKKPFFLHHNLKIDQEYTYIIFVYNLSEKETDDVVETEGEIRNESIP